MLQKKKILPPLDHLLAFEAAAKSGGFSRASEELNISETAISRKVKLLEAHYNTALFIRGPRSVTLTSDGARLYGQVSQAIELLREASRDILNRNQSTSLMIAATNSVASLWLMPKLRRFRRSNPRIHINLVASDDDDECLSEPMDLTILRGNGHWPGFDSRLLFGETIFPVCSPGYLQRLGGSLSIDRLSSLDLIEVLSAHSEWMNWATWFDEIGLPDQALDQAIGFNTYPLSIQAATDGLGVALGWGHLVDTLLASGELVRPIPDKFVRTQSGYYLLTRQGTKKFSEQTTVENWLHRTSERRNRYA